MDLRRDRQRVNKENARQRAREFIATYIAAHKCVDCGESDPRVLTFDHIRGEKHGNIADMVRNGLGLETIKTEIAKCEVRCVNCHSLVTQQRAGLHRARW